MWQDWFLGFTQRWKWIICQERIKKMILFTDWLDKVRMTQITVIFAFFSIIIQDIFIVVIRNFDLSLWMALVFFLFVYRLHAFSFLTASFKRLLRRSVATKLSSYLNYAWSFRIVIVSFKLEVCGCLSFPLKLFVKCKIFSRLHKTHGSICIRSKYIFFCF